MVLSKKTRMEGRTTMIDAEQIYSLWESEDCCTMIPGEDPPRFIDGRLQDEKAVRIGQFVAISWEEACRKRDEFWGWRKSDCFVEHVLGERR